jgi:hypothetical protein
MKRLYSVIIIGLTSLFINTIVAADIFYVIHLKGIVTNKTSGKVLKLGDPINSNDKVKFASADALAVIMGSKGKYTLTPISSGNNTSEFVAVVQSALLPLKSNGHLSTRGTATDAGISDLKSFFGNSNFAIIGNKLSVKIDTKKYPLSDKQLFIYRYVNNSAVISKKIDYTGNLITIDKISLYSNNGIIITPSTIPSVDIYYYNTETKNSNKIVNFTPIFINEDSLKEELTIQINILKNQKLNEDQLEKELLNTVIDIYGKTDEKTFHNWYLKSFSTNK